MTEDEFFRKLETEYLAKIYGFCYQKVNNKADAEDLASDIALGVLKAVRRGVVIENLNAFIWRVSSNTFYKWLRSKKHGNTAYLPELFEARDNVEETYVRNEEENLLRREIALLSENYRRAVILYYFEDKSIAEIANTLGRSSGTVKWWLHDARKIIKEGMSIMREYGEKSYNPGTLVLSCQGMPGTDNEPMSCAKRKIDQNILLAAYKEPVTILQLCNELGISAPYMEDEVQYLTRNQLIKELSPGKYQTDFVILPGGNIDISHRIYNECFPDYYNELLSFLESNRELLSEGKFNIAGFSWNRLLWVYFHIITDIMLTKFKHEVCKIVSYEDISERPNGGKWIALGFNNSYPDNNAESNDGKEYVPSDGPVHKTGKDWAQGFFHWWSGLDSNVFFGLPDGVFVLCREIIKGKKIINELTEDEKYLFSIAVENKLFIKEGNNFIPNYYFVCGIEYVQLEKLAMNLYPKVINLFNKAYQLVLNEYEATIPKHLHRQMGNFLSNYLNTFVTCSLYEGMRNEVLSMPDEFNKEWLSLLATEGE